jgi:hypothetical protein
MPARRPPASQYSQLPRFRGVNARGALKFLLAIVLILEGCASATTPVNKTGAPSPEERRSIVSIYDEGALSAREYVVVNMVEETSCKNKWMDSDATEVDAITQAKHVAQDKGAEGIKNLQCDLSRAMTTTR